MKRLARFLLVLIPVAILLLALHPLGLRVHFEDPTAGAHDVYYPYYAAMIAQYGNLGPLVTLVLTGLLGVLAGITAAKENFFLRKMMLVAAVVAVAASLLNIIYGSMTVIGGVITGLLALHAVLSWYTARQ